jgi:hypothetical protein
MTDIHHYDDKTSGLFDMMSLANPQRLPGGAYFSKILLGGENSFIFQTPKCITKNGIVKTNKKIYTDLLFSSDNDTFIQWVEKLETATQYLIFEKRELWFHNEMELADIEYFFNPSIRLYKHNKYLFRSYIQSPKHIKEAFSIQIYDENENNLTIEDIQKDQKVICILEVLGIKFTATSFHIEYCLRQMMVINDTPLFSKCLIKRKTLVKSKEEYSKPKEELGEPPKEELGEPPKEEFGEPPEPPEPRKVSIEEPEVSLEIHDLSNALQEVNDLVQSGPSFDASGQPTIGLTQPVQNYLEKTEILPEFKKSLKEEHLEKKNELCEIDINIMEDQESVKLKKPNEVYYELYREARKKAKEAKQKAIQAYLEVKRIKNIYLVEEIDTSDDSDVDSLPDV